MSEPFRSYDVTSAQTQVGFYNTLLELYWNTRKITIPAIVKSIETDDKDGRIIVQPLINFSVKTKDGEESMPRSEVKVWPIQVKHGGFIIKAPLRVGDTGYLVSGDRSISEMVKTNCSIVKDDVGEYKDSGNTGPVDMKDYSTNEWEFGFFIPCSWNKDPFEVEDPDKKLIIGNLSEGDKSAYITIDREGNIYIKGTVTFSDTIVKIKSAPDSKVVVNKLEDNWYQIGVYYL